MDNEALWLDGPGREPRIGTAELYEPGEDELLVKVMAIPVQPGEWKIREGLIPIPLKYPTIIGLGISGVVQKVGPGVTRFKPGDRIMSNTSGVLRGDYRFGAYQKFCLVPAALTSKIGETPFKEAANLSTAYAPTSALFLHLGLNRPQAGNRNENPTREKVLIWGISSSLGGIAAQMAADAGYSVVGVASGRHAELAKSLGISSFVDRSSPEVVLTLTGLGPFKAVFAAADSAEDQVKIGEVLAAHGGGTFLSTMGVRKGVQLPQGVSGKFSQYIDDYLSPDNREFTQWVWWDYLEKTVSQGRLKSTPVEAKGDLSQTMAAWKALKAGEVSGKRLVICPNSE